MSALSDPEHQAPLQTLVDMTHYLVAVFAALAAALAFTIAFPAGADTVEWELPFSSAPR